MNPIAGGDKGAKARVALVSLYNREMAFGVRYLSSALRARGHRCDIVFFKQMTSVSDPLLCLELTPNANVAPPHTIRELDILVDTLRSLSPDLVGLSLSSTFFRLARAVTERIRRDLAVPVVWGGVHPTLAPDACIQHADAICVGEGEGAIVDLAETVVRGGDIARIRNLWVRRENGGVARNEPRPLIGDLDALGYPDLAEDEFKHYVEDDRYSSRPALRSEHGGQTYDLMTSRGCPFQCTYCCARELLERGGKGPTLRRRSVASVIGEVRAALALRRNVTAVHFWDDVFTFDADWTAEFARQYRREVGVPFTCYAHPARVDAGMLRALKEAGLDCVNVGIQSGSERISRGLYHRQASNAQIVAAARVMRELGIRPWYDLIVDNPYERDEDYHATLELLLGLPRPFDLNLHSLCHFPKTQLTEQALREGVISAANVEGEDRKGGYQFRMSLDARREPRPVFWNTLLAVSRYPFFPKALIRACSRSGWLRRRPAVLVAGVTAVLRAVRWKRRVAQRRRHGPLSIDAFSARRGPRGIEIETRIASAKRGPRSVVLALRAYPVVNPSYPDRYAGAWNAPLQVASGTWEARVELAFPDVAFDVDGRRLSPRDVWVGAFRENGLYCLELVLYDKEERPLHARMTTVHSSWLFEPKPEGEVSVQGS